uniref:EAL domain-containing protein n=1 Tax=Rhodoferax sp. TaxID=50421 RepID=UPI00351CE339
MSIPIRVLLIESDTGRARAVGQALARTREAWQVALATSLAQARERLADAEFDVALASYRLVDGIAFDLTDLASRMPAVLCVNPDEEWAAARALRQGFSDYIVAGEGANDLDALADLMDAALTRWQTQRQLRETAERYELVLSGSGLAPWDRHLPSGRVFLSKQNYEMLGYSEGELGSDASFWQRLMHPDDWEATHEASEAHLRGETPSYRSEYRMRHKDGHWVWVLSRGRVMERDVHGAPVRMLGIYVDITERRREQDAMARQNRLLQAVSRAQTLVIASRETGFNFEGLLDELLAVTESEYGFVGEVFFTPERQPYLKTFAVSDTARDEASRRPGKERMPRGMMFSNPNTLVGAALASGKPVISNETDSDPMRGGVLRGQVAIDAFLGIPIHHGEEMVAMVGLARRSAGYSQADVDFLEPLCNTIGQLVQARRMDAERQRAQDELQATAALLAEKTKSLATTLDSMNQGIIMVDPGGRIIVCNQYALGLLDIPESLMVTHPSYTDIVRFQAERGDFGDNYAGIETKGRAYVARGDASGAPDKYLRTTRSGRVLELVTRMLPSGDMVRTYTDITEQLRADEKIRESEARFRALTELSSDWYWEQDAEFRFVRVDGDLETPNPLPWDSYIGTTRWGSDAEGVSPAQWDAHRAALQARAVFRDFELQRLRADGTLMWIGISGAPIFDSDGVFQGYRGTGRDITVRKQAEAQIQKLAFYDSLTELPNRQMLLDRLEHAVAGSARHRSHGGLLFIDLDNFKMLNDTMGHDRGDQLLQQVARRLTQCVRHMDTVARLGGDEFVVMLEELSADALEAATQVEAVGKKVLAALNHPFDLAGQHHHTSPSIGATLFFDHMETVDELLKRADLAMYQAKAAGRNTLRFFDPEMQAVVNARAALELDLRQGLAQGELLLHYQPVVDAAGETTGVEALARWVHPRQGMVSPAEFIPLAEQTGLILPLGRWVLETACLQLVAWSTSRATKHLTMSVNVSAREFHHPDFSSLVVALLGKTGANPGRLKLELTESLLLSDVEDAIAKMSELRSIGVNFSLDDFGTGYSSLSYLKRLPLDQLKIDRSFISDVLTDANDAAIVRTILALAQSLGLSVVAEGVETQGQRDFLEQIGCTAFQGYLFGRPVPLDALRLT